jgi:hypothetical protein
MMGGCVAQVEASFIKDAGIRPKVSHAELRIWIRDRGTTMAADSAWEDAFVRARGADFR